MGTIRDCFDNPMAESFFATLQGGYEVVSNDPVKVRLVLKLRATPRAPANSFKQTPQAARATRVVEDLVGPSTQVGALDVDDDSGEVRRIRVTHEAGAKLVAPGYRRRVERTVSTMLPGRWRAQ